jgi:flagellar L-ring protein precursor FlgH
VLTLAAAASASAQNNSLFRNVRPTAPPQQDLPSHHAGIPPAAAAIAAGFPANTADPSPPANPVLLESSLIAVEMPPPRRLQVNDLVTIIVREDKTALSDSKLKSEKDWNVESTFDQWFRLNPEHRLVPTNFTEYGPPGVMFDWQDDYEGKGKVERKDSLILRITATVMDVKPNGNLVLEARKTIQHNEDGYTITLTGSCRAADITEQNTVLSTQVADPVIKVDDFGAARDASKRGWIKRLVDFLNPM